MGSNIIAHLIFFSLYTSYLLILNIPTTTHFEIYSNHCHMFGSSFNNTKFDLMYLKLHQCCRSVLTHWSQVWPYVSQVSTILFTFSHFTFCFSYLFLQNSLSLNEHVQEAGAAKKKPQQKHQTITNLLIFGLLWFFLNTNIGNLIFFL